MRSPTSTVSLFLFLRLASSLPTTESRNRYPQDCHGASCSIKNHTPPSSIPLAASDPHFPSHQLSPSIRLAAVPSIAEIEIDNTPLSPTSTTSQTEALSATHPLSSAYLLSISNNPAREPSIQKAPIPVAITPSGTKTESEQEEPLAAKPTEALAELRKQDAEKYWATISVPDSNPPTSQTEETETETAGGCAGGAYYRIQTLRVTGKDYSDLIVVGLVLLFLAVVVVLEGWERIREMRSLAPQHNSRCGRKGRIFLEDDETVAFVVKKPFLLETDSIAPPTYQVEREFDLDKKEAYDSDAEERV